MDYEEFMGLLHGSIEYTFDETVLELRGYYSGKRVYLDLGRLTEEMYEELVVED